MTGYPNSLQVLESDLKQAFNDYPQSEITQLAADLIEGAKKRDLGKSANLGISALYKGIMRDKNNPPEYNDPSIIGADWADDEAQPLKPGEQWNKHRRATNTGTEYDFDATGRPVNPYHETGLTGRGCLGAYGPNHAVDNGAVVIEADENGVETMYALGIIRKHDKGDVPAFAGGFAKYNVQPDGSYVLDRDTVIDSQTEEFFEEMVSGSVELLSTYEDQLSDLFNAEVSKREAASGHVMSD